MNMLFRGKYLKQLSNFCRERNTVYSYQLAHKTIDLSTLIIFGREYVVIECMSSELGNILEILEHGWGITPISTFT